MAKPVRMAWPFKGLLDPPELPEPPVGQCWVARIYGDREAELGDLCWAELGRGTIATFVETYRSVFLEGPSADGAHDTAEHFIYVTGRRVNLEGAPRGGKFVVTVLDGAYAHQVVLRSNRYREHWDRP